MKSLPFFGAIVLLFFLLQNAVHGQGIKGTVKSNSGVPLPYVSIFIANLNNGSSSNENGEFEIKLPEGKHTVVVQFIGYKAQQVEVTIADTWMTKNFVLQEQGFALQEVQVKGRKEDPAYTIMRKAISKRRFHLLQYTSYQMNLYIKGTGEVTDAPSLLKTN